jgi:hypothetical protein
MRSFFCVSLVLVSAWFPVQQGHSMQIPESDPPTQEKIEEARSAPLFTSLETLHLTIEADFSAIKREDRSQDSEERPAILRWTEPSGTTDSLEIQVGTRGNFRLQKKNCDFPPLRINLKKGSTKGTIFETQDKLKLVVACKTGQSYWQQYVLLEFMAYRTLNVLTELSFRARLAQVTYVDSSGRDDPLTRFAFIIEDDDVMALRNGGRKVDWASGQLDPRSLEDKHAVIVDVFQFMIGNTDWSGVEMHNMELFQTPDRRSSTVPYDFDFSGLVDARYADPDQSLPIRRVRDRLFRGFCPDQMNRAPGTYEGVYALITEKKDEIYELWRKQEGLEEDRVEDSLEYFDDFYEILSDPRRIQRDMMGSCRRLPR